MVRKCPKCKSKNVAKILYGLVELDDKLEKDMRDGKVFLGGCCIFEDNPKYHCNDCEEEF